MWLLSVKIVFGGDPAKRPRLPRKEANTMTMPLGATIGFIQKQNLGPRGWRKVYTSGHLEEVACLGISDKIAGEGVVKVFPLVAVPVGMTEA